ncbi:DUF3618 domain-containing protein [Actinokineospora sp. PR83]|uniref:DUF3618 domain-containing protein n=1 Tax=Actinokineospora sp. PR83 TaxID=2884908 RepID=UPI001F2B3F0F|nr:DUF3618 domain-containing protein [Actinokineospora sp. PR83]MCG8920327.1 DUF3618 domain-containing protein [Actinokineospora sp. PR83]
MSVDPDDKKALAADIEQAREELAETVDALVAKTDVKRRVGEKAEEVKAEVKATVAAKAQEAREKVGHAKDTVVAKAAEAKEKVAEKAVDAKDAAVEATEAAAAKVRGSGTRATAGTLADKGQDPTAQTKDLLAGQALTAKAKADQVVVTAKRNPVPFAVLAAALAAVIALILRNRGR